MQILTLDFETYWDNDYSLKKLSTEAYVRDRRFEALGCGMRVSGMPAWWTARDQLPRMFGTIDWSRTAVLCHHAQFDGLILSHHYGIKPRAWLDTYSMAKLLIGAHIRVSLESLAKHFDLSAKTVPYDLFKGRHWHELSPDAQRKVAAGCCHDVELTYDIFKRLAEGFPAEEYPIVDATIRMFTEPVLELDDALALEVLEREESGKAARAAALDVDPKDLRSDARFTILLEQEGLEVPLKPGKNGPIPALARTDEFMKDLLESDDDRLRALAEARIGARSSIQQTRAASLLAMRSRGALAVYLNYCGAHTTRWSGGGGMNFQNLPRLDPLVPEKNALRRSLRAPEGHLLAKVDLSQIECRILNYVAGQWDVVDRFRNGIDPYLAIASLAYGFEVTREHPTERGTGKQLELSCGFGAGAETIMRTAARGTYGPSVIISLATALVWRDLYRSTHKAVMKYWGQGGTVLGWLEGSKKGRWGPLRVEHQCIWLPNGCPLIYETLEDQGGEWRLGTRKGTVRMYGAKLVENVVQAMARVVISQLMNRVIKAGMRIALTAHDDLVIVVKDDAYAKQALDWLEREACVSPAWLPDIPLGAEAKLGETYE